MRVTILKDCTKKPYDISTYHEYHKGEEYEVGSMLMPKQLADKLVRWHDAKMDNEPVSDKEHAVREHEYLKQYSDGQLYSVNYPPGY